MLHYTSQTRRAQSEELELPNTNYRSAHHVAQHAGAPPPGILVDVDHARPTTDRPTKSIAVVEGDDDIKYIANKSQDDSSRSVDYYSGHSNINNSNDTGLDDVRENVKIDDSDESAGGSAHIQQYYNALTRRNSEPQALGKLRQRRLFFLFTIYCAPDAYINIVVTLFMMFVVYANMFVGGVFASRMDYVIAWTCVALMCLSSFLLMVTEPGVYVRLKNGEIDPLEDHTNLVYCRVCHLRRPPRTSHCYICNVCVLEHDHHCGILGCCVGVRNLRWFVLYCTTTSMALIVGVYWQGRTIYNILNAHSGEADGWTKPNVARQGVAGGASAFSRKQSHLVAGSTHAANEQVLLSDRNVFELCERTGACFELWRLLFSVLLFIIDISFGSILTMLSGLYITLAAQSMTRRMWNRSSSAPRSFVSLKSFFLCCPRDGRTVRAILRKVIKNMKRIFYPPPSMLNEQRRGANAALLGYSNSNNL